MTPLPFEDHPFCSAVRLFLGRSWRKDAGRDGVEMEERGKRRRGREGWVSHPSIGSEKKETLRFASRHRTRPRAAEREIGAVN